MYICAIFDFIPSNIESSIFYASTSLMLIQIDVKKLDGIATKFDDIELMEIYVIMIHTI